MKFCNLSLKHGVFLAPMAGVADSAFRSICRSFGAEAVVSEMISAKAVCYGDKKTEALADIDKNEYPAGIQLFGSESDFIAEAIKVLAHKNPHFFDINMGCPVKKIISAGDGSALMKNPEKCREIISSAVKASKIPVTVKIRAGFDENSINAVEIAKIAEDSGASAVFVHGRTAKQMYSGKADWKTIKSVKDAVKIPVIANGDIKDGTSAADAFTQTGCDGIMIGRGSLGSPWVFKEIICKLENLPYIPLSDDKIFKTINEHIRLILQKKGDHGIVELRKHLAWYVKSRPNSAVVRHRINSVKTTEEVIKALKEVFIN